MFDLSTLYIFRLHQMELITLFRETVTDIEKKTAMSPSSDIPLTRYLNKLKSDITLFEDIIKNPLKHPYTSKLVEKDRERDIMISNFWRKLHYYELSAMAAEREAFELINAVWVRHRGMAVMNRAKKTGEIDNLLNDLSKDRYAAALAVLAMQAETVSIQTANEAYRTLAAESRAARAGRPATDAKPVRRRLIDTYQTLCNYVSTLARAYPEVAEWQTLLAAINVIRRRYAELLARRAGARREPEIDDPAPADAEPTPELPEPSAPLDDE